MSRIARRPLLLLMALGASLLLPAACGDDDERDQDTSADTVADTSGEDVADTNTADTAPEDTAATDTNTGDTGPEAPTLFAPAPCPAVSSTDTSAVGAYTFTEACVGFDSMGAVKLLCPEAGLYADPAPTFTASGSMVLGETTYARIYHLTGEGQLWVPLACADSLADGTCAGLGNLLAGLGGGASVSCTDEATYGGCDCAVSGTITTADAGTYTATAGSTEVTYLDDEGATTTEAYAVDDDGAGNWSIKMTGEGAADTVVVAHLDGAATHCNRYCTYFMALCNDATGVTGYTDFDDCSTQCAGFVTTGATLPVTTGNSVECRITQVEAAAAALATDALATHCPQAQATATTPCVD